MNMAFHGRSRFHRHLSSVAARIRIDTFSCLHEDAAPQILQTSLSRFSPCEKPMTGRLTLYELELMNVLWDLGEATVQQVCDCLDRDLAYTTVMTTLNVLHGRKGCLERTKVGRAFSYRPTVTREEMSAQVLSELRPVLFGRSLPTLMLNLLSSEQLEDGDLEALREALERVEKKRDP